MSNFSSQGIRLPERFGIANPSNTRYRGIAAPFVYDPKGYFGVKGTRDVVWSSIVNILLTPLGWRIMLPEFGSRLPELVFEPNDDLLQGLARTYIFDALERWEPRIRLRSANVYRDVFNDQRLHVDLSYEIVEDAIIEDRSLLISSSGQLATGSLR